MNPPWQGLEASTQTTKEQVAGVDDIREDIGRSLAEQWLHTTHRCACWSDIMALASYAELLLLMMM